MSGLMDVLSIAASAMSAAQAQLNVTANNIANLNTPGYQSQAVDLVDLSPYGVGVGGVSSDTASGSAGSTGQESSSVDLASQMTDLSREKLLYTANAAVFRAGDQMLGSLLDMFDNDRDSQDQADNSGN